MLILWLCAKWKLLTRDSLSFLGDESFVLVLLLAWSPSTISSSIVILVGYFGLGLRSNGSRRFISAAMPSTWLGC